MITSGFIKSIQDIMRKDRGIGTGDVVRQLDQLIWMIFLKAFDDIETQKHFIDSTYHSIVPVQYRWRTWATAEDGITGDRLLEFINNDLMVSLKNLPAEECNTIIRIAFEESHNYMKDGTLLRQVVNKINLINFNSTDDRHTFNDLYETLLNSLQSAGDAGEYYTPRAVTKLVTEMVAPKLGESVLDPACGTGGFLSSAIDILHAQAKTPEDMKLVEESILGVEKMQLPYSLCVVNMMLHGIDNPANVRYDNTLSKPLISYGPKDFVDTIVANPPFGGQEVDGIEKNFPASFRTRETADLFLILMIRLLKDGGRAGIVLPDSTLSGEGVKTRIKEHLLEECNLHTIVRLPKSVFAPYTTIATNLLFFTKGTPTKEIWYYEHHLPEGIKSYNKTNPIKGAEFEPLKEWWRDRKENNQAWKVSVEDVKKRNYNLDFKNPSIVEIDELNPEDILEDYRQRWLKIDNIADQLKLALDETLQHHSNKSTHYLTKHLHEYLRVPHATTQLRKTILHLAVSGQLVPQDSSDGTGEELYEQIQFYKSSLISEGKLKKQKLLPRISEKETPYEIPNSWTWVRLGDVSEIFNGNSISAAEKTHKYTKINDGYPYLATKDIGYGFEKVNYENGIKVPFEEKGFKIVSPGTVLICSEGGSAGKKCAIIQKTVAFGNKMYAFKSFNDAIIPNFVLYNYLTPQFFSQFQEKMTGIIGGISLTSFKELLLPLPPQSEQTRIVQKTTQLLDLVTKLETHLEK